MCQPQHAIPGNVKAAASGGAQPVSVNLAPWQVGLNCMGVREPHAESDIIEHSRGM